VWEVPAEHLLDFHDFIHWLEIIHEYVQINLSRYSLEGFSLNWCRSLPNASISSLENFHAAFHLFCKDIFSVDLLYPECCHDFNLLNKYPNIHEDFATAEDISHHDQGIVDPHYNNHGDSFEIVLNASIKYGCVGRLVVVIDVNPSHGFWTAILMKVFGHEGQCTCR
jgi:hypothetical protein